MCPFPSFISVAMASLPCFRAPCVPRRGEAQPRARSSSLAPCRARSRRAKNLSLLIAADASSSPNDAVASAPPPSTDDDIDALISALAKTTLGAGIDEKELFKLLRPSSSPAKAGGKAPSGGEKGGAAAAEGERATSSSSASSSAAPTSNTKSRKLGPAELLKNLLAASAPDAEAAATGTVRLLQSLDDDDEDAFSSYEEDYESDGESSSAASAVAAASASTSSADFSPSPASSDAVVGPRLRAELGTLVLKAFDTAAGMTASSFPDAARAASRGRLTRESLAALLGRGGAGGDGGAARRDAAAVDDLLLRFGLRDGSSGELYLGYAGFLKLLASEVADLRAVLRYAALEVPAAVGEAEAAADAAEKAEEAAARTSSSSSSSSSSSAAASASSASASVATAPPAATSPSLATSSADFTFRPGTVALIFGGVRVFFEFEKTRKKRRTREREKNSNSSILTTFSFFQKRRFLQKNLRTTSTLRAHAPGREGSSASRQDSPGEQEFFVFFFFILNLDVSFFFSFSLSLSLSHFLTFSLSLSTLRSSSLGAPPAKSSPRSTPPSPPPTRTSPS